MMCNDYECPFRNEMGCKVIACARSGLTEKYNSFYTTDHTTTGFPTYTNRTIDKGGDK